MNLTAESFNDDKIFDNNSIPSRLAHFLSKTGLVNILHLESLA
jgi:hypothetical protein